MKRLFQFLICAALVFSLFGGLLAQTKQLSIDECVKIAIEKNPTILMSRFSREIASKDVLQSMSGFMPRVSANLGYYHSVVGPSSQLRIDPGTGIPVPLQPSEIKSWSSSASISVNQTLFSGGNNYFNLKRSKSLENSASYQLEDTKQQTIYIVKERYYNLLKADHLLTIADETIKSSEESYKRAQILFDVGKAPKSDVLKAKVQLEKDRLSQIEAENGLAVAKASLNYILGFSVDHELDIVDNLDVPEMNVNYDDAMDQAFTKHPTLKRAQWDVRAAQAALKASATQFMPTLSAYYSYSWRNEDFNKIDKMFDKDYNWYAGLQFSLPIFQGLTRYASLSQAKLTLGSQKVSLDQVKRDIALEVKQACFDVKQARKKILVTQDAITAAEEDLRLNREKYSLGAGTMLDLLNAQVSYATAQSDNVQSLYDYKYAVARLEKAMGMLKE